MIVTFFPEARISSSAFAMSSAATPWSRYSGLTTEGDIAFADGGYESKRARAVRGAWFRDSEGNMLGLVQFVP
jgi:hypothetical protein